MGGLAPIDSSPVPSGRTDESHAPVVANPFAYPRAAGLCVRLPIRVEPVAAVAGRDEVVDAVRLTLVDHRCDVEQDQLREATQSARLGNRLVCVQSPPFMVPHTHSLPYSAPGRGPAGAYGTTVMEPAPARNCASGARLATNLQGPAIRSPPAPNARRRSDASMSVK